LALRRYREAIMKASLGIAADLRQRIASGELKDGDPLPVESELVGQLGASKSVVREALRILEGEGLLEVRRGLGGGPRVRHPSISDAAQGVGVYLQIGDVPVLDAWTARDRIIGGAVERLAGEQRPPTAAALEDSVEVLGSVIGDFDAYYHQLIEVAERAVQLAGNTTEHVLVVALRHIIAAELDAVTREVVNVSEAVDAERYITSEWRTVVRHVRAGRRVAARRAYDRQADLIARAIERRSPGVTVVDAVASSGSLLGLR